MIERETITIEVLHATCGRCGYKWDLKRGRIPKNCPHCNSPYWNAERKHKTHEPRAAKPPKPTAEEIEAARAERTAAARAKLEAQRPVDSLVAAILAGRPVDSLVAAILAGDDSFPSPTGEVGAKN